MHKFLLYFISAIAVLVILFLAIVFVPHIYLTLAPVRHNDNFSDDTNESVIRLVNQALRIHYGSYCRDVAKDIFSDELLQRIDSGRGFTSLREGRRFIRLVDRNYMQSLSYIAVNDRGERLLQVIVRVEEGIFIDPFDLIHWFTIMRCVDGTFIIVDIDYDT